MKEFAVNISAEVTTFIRSVARSIDRRPRDPRALDQGPGVNLCAHAQSRGKFRVESCLGVIRSIYQVCFKLRLKFRSQVELELTENRVTEAVYCLQAL